MASKEIDDRFKKFGTVSFLYTSKVNDFIDYLEEGKLMTTYCRKCDKTFFPPRAHCSGCLSEGLEWIEVDKKGSLETYSHMQYGPSGFESDLPYTIAVLDFKDFKIFGRLSNNIDLNKVKIGMGLVVKPNQLQEGKINFIFDLP